MPSENRTLKLVEMIDGNVTNPGDGQGATGNARKNGHVSTNDGMNNTRTDGTDNTTTDETYTTTTEGKDNSRTHGTDYTTTDGKDNSRIDGTDNTTTDGKETATTERTDNTTTDGKGNTTTDGKDNSRTDEMVKDGMDNLTNEMDNAPNEGTDITATDVMDHKANDETDITTNARADITSNDRADIKSPNEKGHTAKYGMNNTIVDEKEDSTHDETDITSDRMDNATQDDTNPPGCANAEPDVASHGKKKSKPIFSPFKQFRKRFGKSGSSDLADQHKDEEGKGVRLMPTRLLKLFKMKDGNVTNPSDDQGATNNARKNGHVSTNDGKNNTTTDGKDNSKADGTDCTTTDGKDNSRTDRTDNTTSDETYNKTTDGKKNSRTDETYNTTADGKENTTTEWTDKTTTESTDKTTTDGMDNSINEMDNAPNDGTDINTTAVIDHKANDETDITTNDRTDITSTNEKGYTAKDGMNNTIPDEKDDSTHDETDITSDRMDNAIQGGTNPPGCANAEPDVASHGKKKSKPSFSPLKQFRKLFGRSGSSDPADQHKDEEGKCVRLMPSENQTLKLVEMIDGNVTNPSDGQGATSNARKNGHVSTNDGMNNTTTDGKDNSRTDRTDNTTTDETYNKTNDGKENTITDETSNTTTEGTSNTTPEEGTDKTTTDGTDNSINKMDNAPNDGTDITTTYVMDHKANDETDITTNDRADIKSTNEIGYAAKDGMDNTIVEEQDDPTHDETDITSGRMDSVTQGGTNPPGCVNAEPDVASHGKKKSKPSFSPLKQFRKLFGRSGSSDPADQHKDEEGKCVRNHDATRQEPEELQKDKQALIDQTLKEKKGMPNVLNETTASLKAREQEVKQHVSENKQKDADIARLQAEIESLQQEKSELILRLSKLASAKLTQNNPNIADLSDTNRPTVLAERFSELYDNEYTDAFEELGVVMHLEDNANVQLMLALLQATNDECVELSKRHEESLKNLVTFSLSVDQYPILEEMSVLTDTAEDPNTFGTSIQKDAGKVGINVELTVDQTKSLSDIRKICASRFEQEGSISKIIASKMAYQNKIDPKSQTKTMAYITKCAHVCWYMAIQEPRVVIEFHEVMDGEPFNKDWYKQYTKGGTMFDFIVWPPMFLYKEGPMLCKGVAQGKN